MIEPEIQPGPGAFTPPYSTNGELNDLLLDRLMQQTVAQITGLDGDLVRPRWQENPPDPPERDVSWAAVGGLTRTRPAFAFVDHHTSPINFDLSHDRVIRNQELEILASFYGPKAQANSEVFAIGIALEQNRYQLMQNGFNLILVRETVTAPALVKNKWLRGEDVRFSLRRQQIYKYKSPNLIGVPFCVDAGEGGKQDFKVEPGYGQLPYGIGPFNL